MVGGAHRPLLLSLPTQRRVARAGAPGLHGRARGRVQGHGRREARVGTPSNYILIDSIYIFILHIYRYLLININIYMYEY